MKNKIVDFLELKKIRKKNKNKIIGLAHGAFDLLHYGHLLHLRKAKCMCDILIVSVTSSKYIKKGPGRPLYSDDQRLDYLSSISLVDCVVLSNYEGAIEVINNLKPNIYIKGNEYKKTKNDFTGKISKEINAVLKNKGKIHFTDEPTFSSSNIINNNFSSYTDSDKKYHTKIKKYYNFQKIESTLNNIEKCKVLVLGDTIIDKYIFSAPLGKSPKEDIISVKEGKSEIYAGGILATANHISEFVKDITLLTVFGENNKNNDLVIKKLNKKIKKKIFYKKSSHTITKTRYLDVSSNIKLFQTSNNDEISLDNSLEKKIISFLKRKIKYYDIVIINDFGHGLLTRKIRNCLQNKSKYLTVNTQTNSANIGFNYINKYRKANYITMDEPEARLALQDKHSKSSILFWKLKKNIKFDLCAITFGAQGTRIFDNKNIHFAPVLSKNVVDSLGAGDAFFSISSIFSKNIKDIILISLIGNIAGSMQTRYLGHRSYITKSAFLSILRSLLS